MTAAGFRSALDDVDRMCANHKACQKKYGEKFSDRVIAAIKTYEETPMELTGVRLDRAVGGKVIVNAELAAVSIFRALYSRDVYGDLPAMLDVLESRDESTLRDYVNVLGFPIDHMYGRGMDVAISCRAGFRETPGGRSHHFEGGELLARWMGPMLYHEGCEDYFRSDPDPSVRPTKSDKPILLVAGTADPITPPSYADYVKPNFSNLTYVEFPNTGHGGLVSNFDCGKQIIVDFVTQPNAEVDASCAAETPAPDFFINIRKTKKPYAFARNLQSGIYPRLPILAVGSLLLVLIGFPLGWIARKIDATETISLRGGRLLAWSGSALAIGASALAIKTILDTGLNHTASLPVGVPQSITLSGWLALIGAVATIAAIVQLFRQNGEQRSPIGTKIAVVSAAIGTIILFFFVRSIGVGPF